MIFSGNLAISSVLDLSGKSGTKGGGRERGGWRTTGWRHVRVSDWERRRSPGIRGILSLAFSKCGAIELINIHWPARAYVSSDRQNKVAEVTHFTRGEREKGWAGGVDGARRGKWAPTMRESAGFQTERAKRSKHQKRAEPPGLQRGKGSLLRLKSCNA